MSRIQGIKGKQDKGNRKNNKASGGGGKSPHLLVGTESPGTVEEVWGKARIFYSRFQAVASGTVSTLGLITGTTACTCTSVVLGIYEDNAGKPGNILGQAIVARTPGKNELITVAVSIPVIAGTKYWLAVLPIGGEIFAPLGAPGGTGETLQTEHEPKAPSYTKMESNPGLNEAYAGSISMQAIGS
jgi:hypothetical protein